MSPEKQETVEARGEKESTRALAVALVTVIDAHKPYDIVQWLRDLGVPEPEAARVRDLYWSLTW